MRNIIHSLLWYYRHKKGIYEEPAAARLSGMLEPTACCIDVGAHAGSWSAALARMCPQGEIIAFEALPYYAEVLRRTLRYLRLPNVRVENLAVSESDGMVPLVHRDSEGKALTGLTHIASPREGKVNAIAVSCISLDSYLTSTSKRVSFIKIDVEGAELMVLRGAKKILKGDRPIIYSEVNPAYCMRYGHEYTDVFSFLSELRYASLVEGEDKSLMRMSAIDYADTTTRDVWFIPVEKLYLFGTSEAESHILKESHEGR